MSELTRSHFRGDLKLSLLITSKLSLIFTLILLCLSQKIRARGRLGNPTDLLSSRTSEEEKKGWNTRKDLCVVHRFFVTISTKVETF